MRLGTWVVLAVALVGCPAEPTPQAGPLQPVDAGRGLPVAAGLVAGLAVDGDGKPVPGADVMLEAIWPDGGSRWLDARTADAQGQWLLNPQGACPCRLQASTATLAGRLDLARPEGSLKLVLKPWPSVTVQVKDPMGRAVPTARVRVESDTEPAPDGFDTASGYEPVDAQGRYTFAAVKPGTQRISAIFVAPPDGPHTGLGMVQALQAIDVVEAMEVTLSLGAGGTASGRVLDEAKKPMAGVRVEARAEGRTGPEAWSWTDADGRFVIRGLGDGAHVLVPVREGHTLLGEAPHVDAAGATLTMRRVGGVRGRVLGPDKQPLKEFSLVRDGSGATEAVHDAQGRYEHGSPPGVQVECFAVTTSVHLPERVVKAAVKPGQWTAVADVQVGPSRPVTIRVVDGKSGGAISGAQVAIEPPAGCPDVDLTLEVGSTDDDGSVHFDLAPDDVMVRVLASGVTVRRPLTAKQATLEVKVQR